jgi:hypothetical protein
VEPDPRGLIAEAYRMPDLDEAECRSIFLDWVLGQPEGSDVAALAAILLEKPDAAPGHPMSAVLRSATSEAGSPPRRRGGRSRVSAPNPPPPTQDR